MAALAALPALPLILTGVGAAVSAVGTIASGQAAADVGHAEQRRLQVEGINAKNAADFEAAQYDIQAKEEHAAGQREMLAARRQKKLALSSLTARAAGSGFTATDPTALAIGDEIERYGTLQEQMALAGGASRRSGLELSAEGRRFSGQSALDSAYARGEIAAAEGKAKRTASYFDAAGTLITAGSSMADKYAKRQTPKTTSRYG